jgi:hypothetical protein
MIVNHFKMRSNIITYNLSGMGCSAGVISIGLAQQLLQVRRSVCSRTLPWLAAADVSTTSSISEVAQPLKAFSPPLFLSLVVLPFARCTPTPPR